MPASWAFRWGISEAAFNARDHNLNYQHTNFGVHARPKCGLATTPSSPLRLDPRQPVQTRRRRSRTSNARASSARLENTASNAVDFTPTRVPEGQDLVRWSTTTMPTTTVSTAAVANVAFNGHLRELFHPILVIEAAELMLQEKARATFQ